MLLLVTAVLCLHARNPHHLQWTWTWQRAAENGIKLCNMLVNNALTHDLKKIIVLQPTKMHNGWLNRSPWRRLWGRYRRKRIATQYTWSSRFCLHQRTSYNCRTNRHLSVVSSRWSVRRLEPYSDAPATPLHNIRIFIYKYARNRQSLIRNNNKTTTTRIVIYSIVCRHRSSNSSSSAQPSIMSLDTHIGSIRSRR